MASPAWLPQEVQSSTSQASVSNAPAGEPSQGPPATASAPAIGSYNTLGMSGTKSECVQDPPQAKFAAATTSNVISPSFSYNVLPNASSASGCSQQPTSSPVIRSNVPGLSTFLQPPVPGQFIGAGPSFTGNMPHGGVSFSHGPQFQSIMPTAAVHAQGEQNIPPPPMSLKPPLPEQLPRPIAAASGIAANIISPPAHTSTGFFHGSSLDHSFNRNPQLMQKDQSIKSDMTVDLSHKNDFIPSASSAFHSAHANSGSQLLVSTNNLHPSSLWMPSASFQVVSGKSASSVTPGPPGVNPSVPSPYPMTAPSTQIDSSAAVRRPVMPVAPFPTNAAVQQQSYSVPPLVGPPQGPWFQPPYVGGLPRPPFVPTAAFPGHFVSPARGISITSVALPDHRPPAVTPEGAYAALPRSSSNSVSQSAINSVIHSELPPGIGKSVNIGNAVANEQLDAWTAHRTEAGVLYYYNALTGESTYDKPPGFKGEPDRVTAQPIPISMEKLGGTDWALVTTNDGKKYYYNSRTKSSSWQIPTEVAELKKKKDADVVREQSMSVQNSNISTEKGSVPISLSAPAVNTGGRDATPFRASGVPGSSSALDLIKKKLQDSGAPATSSPIPVLSGAVASDSNGSKAVEAAVKGPQSDNSKEKPKDADSDGNLFDSSSDSDGEDSGPTKEERIIQFKEMLKERGVAPFSKWEKELPKIVFDPRFKAIPSHSARRAIFEHYVRTRADEERKEKRASQKAATEGFKQLLDEAKEDIDHNTDYQTFRKKCGSDPRFEALDRKEIEVLLNERVLPLKRAAEEKAQALRATATSGFKSMLRDKGDITTNSRWSRVKDSLRDDPRYKSVKHEDRETLFNEYIYELKAAEEEAGRVAKSKLEEEEKLKERERTLRKRKEREEQEVERVRVKARRKEAVESYQALLMETIKDSQASWTESKSKLERDPQGRVANPHLDQSDLERFFREHVKILQERCALEFRALLAEVVTPEAAAQETEDGKTVLMSWSTAKRLIKADPRYTKMPRKDRESFWRRHVEDIQRRQKSSHNKDVEKHRETRNRSSADTGKHLSESRRKQ